MKSLVIGDVHFGCRSNNKTWLTSQIDFFNKQIIPNINKNSYDNVIFLGDVFDIRYSTNTEVGIEVKKLFRKLANICKDIYIIAGNHDYYSPIEDFEEYNVYELVFGKEFTDVYTNIHFIQNSYIRVEDVLMLPWYYTENDEKFNKVISENKDAKIIYCHSDLSSWTEERVSMLSNKTIYAGHIHYPWEDKKHNLYNLGACCSFNFNDVNQKRYIYVINDGKIELKIENTTTPLFKRFYNEEIFTLSELEFKNSIVQLCVSQSNINKARYIEHIKDIKATYIDANVKVNIVDDDIIEKIEGVKFDTNIEKYIKDNIPEHLSEKYELIKEQLKESENI